MKDTFDIYEWNKKRYLSESDGIDLTYDQSEYIFNFLSKKFPDIKKEYQRPLHFYWALVDAKKDLGENKRSSFPKKIDIIYTGKGQFYKADVDGKSMNFDKFKSLLLNLGVTEEPPINLGGDGVEEKLINEKLLNEIIAQLKYKGIEADWDDDIMDVS